MRAVHNKNILYFTICPLVLLAACSVGGDDSTDSFGTGLTGSVATDGTGDRGSSGSSSAGSGAETGMTGGGSADTTGGGSMPDAGEDVPETTGVDPDPEPDPDVSSCSIFGDASGLFTFVNQARADYAGEGIYLPHARYKGIPWQGSGHDNYTFSTKMIWDEDLAAQATAEAQQLVAGANPDGTKVNGQASIHNAMWIAGVNTAGWKITVTEDLDDWQSDPNNPFSSDVAFALDKSNGSARQGLLYHDFGGDGPAIHRVGVGGALGEGPSGDCQVWWVLQFGP